MKQAVSVDEAVARPRAEVSADIDAAAERALRNVTSVPPWTPALPAGFENHFGCVLPEMAAVALNFPHARVVDNKTVGVAATDFLEAYLAFRTLARFTGLVSQRLLLDGVRGQPGGREIVQKTQQGPPSRRERTFAPTGTTIDRPYGRHGYR